MILNVMVIGTGGYLIFQGDLSVGEFIALYTIFINVGHSVSSLSLILSKIVQTEVSLKRIHELLAYQSNVEEAAMPKGLTSIKGPIVFHNVTFGYQKNRIALEEASIVIPEGGYTAFVGTSGSGKSTAIQLLLRFYDPTKGAIILNGTDLRLYREQDFRVCTGVVFQNSFLFNMTIRENIALAKPEATDEDIIHAAKLAQIHETIAQLPEGYDTVITQYGENLSGGQRQRLAIARALVRNPQLLVLDEITSALDPATEAEINKVIESFKGSRTVVSVTHRLSSVVRADHIVVFQNGRVIEQGSHQQLTERNGWYRQMWEKQTGFQLTHDGSRARVDIGGLARLPFFAELDDEQLHQVSSLFLTEKFDEGQTIIRQGEEGDKFYIIVRGSVAVMKPNVSGRSDQVAILQDGEYFGETALLRNIPRTADIITVAPSVLLSLQREHFFTLTHRFPYMMKILEETLMDRAR